MDPSETVLTVYDDSPPPPLADEGSTPMPEVLPPVADVPAAPPADVPAAPPADVPAVPTDAPVATTEVPSAPAADDLAKLAQATGGDSTLTIVLALVAVVGGGAAFKFYSSFSAQKHEQAMKKLEITAGNSAQHPACKAAAATVDSALSEIRGRLDAVEKKAKSMTTLSADVDVEELERQVKRLAKAVKALQD